MNAWRRAPQRARARRAAAARAGATTAAASSNSRRSTAAVERGRWGEAAAAANAVRSFAYLHKVRRDAVLELERAQVGVDLLGVMVAQLRIALCEGV